MKLFAAMLCLLWASAGCAGERWAVYYGTTLPAEAFAPFDLVVLDAEHAAPVAVLKAQGKTVLGYLSLGEAETYRAYYKEMKARKLLLAPNPQWKGHYVIDIRKPEWETMLTTKLIPQILAQGFDGVMFDTIDSPLHLEHKTPEEQKQMQQAAVDLLCSIRKAYPSAKFMLNRGFDILPEAAPCIDMLLAESTRTDLQLETDQTIRMLSDEEYGWYVTRIKEAQLASPTLKIYALDYWPQSDHKGIKKIYTDQRANGFIPYVSTIDLQQVYSVPGE